MHFFYLMKAKIFSLFKFWFFYVFYTNKRELFEHLLLHELQPQQLLDDCWDKISNNNNKKLVFVAKSISFAEVKIESIKTKSTSCENIKTSNFTKFYLIIQYATSKIIVHILIYCLNLFCMGGACNGKFKNCFRW